MYIPPDGIKVPCHTDYAIFVDPFFFLLFYFKTVDVLNRIRYRKKKTIARRKRHFFIFISCLIVACQAPPSPCFLYFFQ